MPPENIFIRSRTRRLALIAMAASLSTATNYLLVGLPNFKPMDFIVFVSGFLLGPLDGAATGVLSWSIYGTINPYGYSFPVFIATSLGETLYGLAGGIMARRLTEGQSISVALAVQIGAFATVITLVYDIFTTIVAAWASGIAFSSDGLYVVFLASVPFFIVHELGNLIFFSLASVPVLRPIDNLYGRHRQWP